MLNRKPIYLHILLLCLLALFLLGCASRIHSLDSRITPNINLHAYKTFYVVQHAKDTRHLDKIIRDQMRGIGLKAESGPAGSKPPGMDVIVTYEDRWTWDVTMYLLSLSIDLRDSRNDLLLATGKSYRFSFARKPPEFMAREILEAIFK